MHAYTRHYANGETICSIAIAVVSAGIPGETFKYHFLIHLYR